MRGRQVFLESLLAHGVDAVFGNPGTTENPLLDSLIDYPQLPYYVALQESVAMSAASFYAQAKGKPAVVNLHVAPGLGNAIGMIFGALKANSPVLVTAGQQDTRMRLRDPLLSYDLVEMARPVTKWSAEPRTADELGPMLARAFKIAMTPPRGPVFVSLPVDVMSRETSIEATTGGAGLSPPMAAQSDLELLAQALSEADRPAIIAGDDIATFGGADALVRIAEASGAAVYHECLPGHSTFPSRHPNFKGRLAFYATAIQRQLAEHDVILMVGGQFFEEVWYDATNLLPPAARVLQIENNPTRLAHMFSVDVGIVADIRDTLGALAERLRRSPAADARNATHATAFDSARRQIDERLQAGWDERPMTPARAAFELAEALPDDVIVTDESITLSGDVANAFDFTGPHSYYGGRGGGIGQGIAGVLGVQAAHPNRTVVCLSGDGSAMYSIQALWTAAHHDLPILFVIWANREYRVLKHNLDIYRTRYDVASNNPYPHMDLNGPVLDFVTIAQGHGVAGRRIDTPEDIGPAVRTALAARQPYLLEIVIAGKPEK